MKKLISGLLFTSVSLGISAQVSFTEVVNTEPVFALIEGLEESEHQLIDLDGDGDLDIFLVGQENFEKGSVKIYLNDGIGNFRERRVLPFVELTNATFDFADIDNDGDQDVLLNGFQITGERRGIGSSALYLNDGSGNFESIDASAFEAISGGTIHFEDFDGDGNKDVFITGRNTSSALSSLLYLGAGDGTFQLSTSTFVGLWISTVDVGDVDNDDDLDIIIAGRDDSDARITKLYLNDGSGNFEEDSEAALEGINEGTVKFHDLEGDGDLDILLTGDRTFTDLVFKIYENNGSGAFIEIPNTFTPVELGDIAIADLNNDGIEDITVVGSTTGNSSSDPFIATYYRMVDGSFVQDSDNGLIPLSRDSHLSIGDVNGDGNQDILLSGERQSNDEVIRLHLGDGQGSFTRINNLVFPPVSWSSAVFNDLDNDGDQDLIYAGRIAGLGSSEGRTTFLYTNDGSGNLIEQESPFVGISNGVVLSEDIDGDNDMDVIIIGRDREGDEIARVYLNNGSGAFQEAIEHGLPGAENGGAAFADVDGDGDLDAMVTGEDENSQNMTALYLNNGNGSFSLSADNLFQELENSAVSFADIDQDGDQDVLVIGRDGSFGQFTELYTNDGNGIFQKVDNTGLERLERGTIDFFDSDQDGDPDLLLTGRNDQGMAKAVLYTNDGDGIFTITSNSFRGIESGAADVADVDGDGDLDIMISGLHESSTNISSLYINMGNNLFVDSGIDFLGTERSSLDFADLDGDMLPELFLTGRGERETASRLYRNTTLTAPRIEVYAETEAQELISEAQVSAINFGNVIIGESETIQFTVKNTGMQDLLVEEILAVGEFTTNSSPTYAIASGDSIVFEVQLSAEESGISNSFITIVSNNGSGPLFQIPVTGTRGQLIPRIYWSEEGVLEDEIIRSNLDGNGIQRPYYTGARPGSGSGGDDELFIREGISELVLDSLNNMIFWSHTDGAVLCGRLGDDGFTATGGPILQSNEGPVTGLDIDPENSHIYWCDYTNGTIKRTGFDGLGTLELIATQTPIDVILHKEEGKLYYTTEASSGIWKANLDGSSPEQIVSDKAHRLDLDLENDQIYWTTYDDTGIKRANLDGSNVEVVTTRITRLSGLALDAREEMIYVVETFGGVSRISFDDSSIEALHEIGLTRPQSVALDLRVFRDQQKPVAVAQDITVSLDENGVASVDPLQVDNGSSDETTLAENLQFSLSVSEFDCTNLGDNIVTLTVTDEAGRASEASATITVVDQIAPVAISQDITVGLDEDGLARISVSDIDNGSTDNCSSNLSSVLNESIFDCTQLGENRIALIVLDASGNTSIDSATVTIVDDLSPEVATKDITVVLGGESEVTIEPSSVDDGSFDNCGITLSLDKSSFDASDLGENTVTLTAIDEAGNSAFAVATVTVLACETESIWYLDADGDGFGDENNIRSDCDQPEGFVANNEDCDDTNELINPLTVWYADTDGDGFGNAESTIQSCEQPLNHVLIAEDCDDTDVTINSETVWYVDADGDGFGDENEQLVQCEQPEGYVINNLDCEDEDEDVYPDAPALPDGKDNNCDGEIDRVSQTITFEPIADISIGEQQVELQASASSGLGVLFAITSGPASISGNTVTFNGIGTVTVKALQDGDNRYLPALAVEQSFEITRVTSVEDALGADYIVYPNPAQDQMTISTSGRPLDQVTILNVNGGVHAVIERPADLQKIDVSGWPGGIYFLQMIHEDRKKLIRVIVQ